MQQANPSAIDWLAKCQLGTQSVVSTWGASGTLIAYLGNTQQVFVRIKGPGGQAHWFKESDWRPAEKNLRSGKTLGRLKESA